MKDGNDPAYPQHGWSSNPDVLERMKDQGGLTKREYFAAMAMQGMIAGSQGLDISVKEFGAQSVKLADALIAALNEKKND